MAQTTLIIDDETAEVIKELRKSFGTTTNAATIRRALALARIAAQNSTDDTVTLVTPTNQKKQIIIRG